MTGRVAVVQPLPGIGDMIFHLPHIRAIAEHVGHPVTLIAKPRSRADQIFGAEQTIRDVFWLDRNPHGRRGEHAGAIGFHRAVRALRARQFDATYLLHHSTTIAIQAMLAGIPRRYGYGIGVQRWFLNRPPVLPISAKRLHPFERATAWLQAAGIPIAEIEPVLPVDPSIVAAVRARIADVPVAIGIGSSDPARQWGTQRFAALAQALAQRGVTSMALVGGPGEASMVGEIAAAAPGVSWIDTTTWSVPEVAAALSLSAFYIGNDSGFMNVAAAVGVRAYALSGAMLSFRHSSRVIPIVPPGGPSRNGGMMRISLDQVLAELDANQALRRFGKVSGLTT